MTRIKSLTHVLSIFAVLCLLFASTIDIKSVSAKTITVTNTNDDGPGSLRQVILDADPDDTIIFDSDLSGGVIISGNTLIIDKNLVIDGSSLAEPITIDGGESYSVFEVINTDSGIVATFDSIIIKNGRAFSGGGILIRANNNVTVANCTFSQNIATSSNGGGIWNYSGTLTVTNSTFTGNRAGDKGGAIYNGYGTITVTNSTFMGNTAFYGGGIYNGPSGFLTLINSTLSGNDAYLYGSGIYNSSTSTLNYVNTIIDKSMVITSACSNAGVIGTNLKNWVSDGTCSPEFSGNPLLAFQLADNGGKTKTLALLIGSGAIDTGDLNSCPATDQRGVTRPVGAGCDIGSYEYALFVYLPMIVK